MCCIEAPKQNEEIQQNVRQLSHRVTDELKSETTIFVVTNRLQYQFKQTPNRQLF